MQAEKLLFRYAEHLSDILNILLITLPDSQIIEEQNILGGNYKKIQVMKKLHLQLYIDLGTYITVVSIGFWAKPFLLNRNLIVNIQRDLSAFSTISGRF